MREHWCITWGTCSCLGPAARYLLFGLLCFVQTVTVLTGSCLGYVFIENLSVCLALRFLVCFLELLFWDVSEDNLRAMSASILQPMLPSYPLAVGW